MVPLMRVIIPPGITTSRIVPGGMKAGEGIGVVSATAPARSGAGTASTAATGVKISSASNTAAPGASVTITAPGEGTNNTAAVVTPGTTGSTAGSIDVGNAPVAGTMSKGTPPIVHLTALAWLTMPSISNKLISKPSPATVFRRMVSTTIGPGTSVRFATTLTMLPTTTGSIAVFTSA